MHDKVTVIDAAIPDVNDDPIIINQDIDWCIGKGARRTAYSTLYRRCSVYVQDRQIDAVVVKASAADDTFWAVQPAGDLRKASRKTKHILRRWCGIKGVRE